jgi:HlyD family secretion protein
MLKYLSILIAVAGISLGVYVASTEGAGKPPVQPPAVTPSVNPFPDGIAASGVIEARSRNKFIAVPDSGLVTQVLVQVGDKVEANAPLFQLDTRTLEADLIRSQAAVKVQEAILARWRAAPRSEELPPLVAAVQAAESRVKDLENEYEDLRTAGSSLVSQREIDRRSYAVQTAKAELSAAQAQLKLTQSGTWNMSIDVAEAELAAAKADLASTQTRIDRLTVRAPIAGTILKRNIEPGQYAAAASNVAAIVLGDLSVLHVRARVDEEDAPLLIDDARAVMRVRGVDPVALGSGDAAFAGTTPLKMIRIEPLAEPKTTLTGDSRERVDTRVIEVVLEVAGQPSARIFPGQVVDVFLESRPRRTRAAEPAPAPAAPAAGAKNP